MFSRLSNSTIICVILGLMVFYYYNKFQDSEMEYLSLHKKFDQVYTENQKVKTRLKDLQYYKNDVSKTFKILDKELEQISDHIYKQNPALVENESYQNQNREEIQMENVQTHTLPSNVQGNPPIREPIRRNTINPMRTIRRTVTTPIGPISTIYTLPIQQQSGVDIRGVDIRQGTFTNGGVDIRQGTFTNGGVDIRQGILGQLGNHSFQRDSINPIVITPDILTSLFTMNTLQTNTSNDIFTNGVDIRQGNTNENENENIESQNVSVSEFNQKKENNKETNEENNKETNEENNKENVSVPSNDVFITDNIQNSLNEEGNLYDVNYLSSNENYEQYLL